MKKLVFIFGLCVFQANAQLSFEENRESLLDVEGIYGDDDIGAGVSFYDFNGDGWDDITMASSETRDFQFYENQEGQFVSVNLGISSGGLEARQAMWVDFDNDGDLDFFSTSDEGRRCWLFENNLEDGFTDITVSAGIAEESFNYWGASWGDIDNDGLLDLFLSVRDLGQVQPNLLYHNNGDGTFTDISVDAGISPIGFISFCSSFFDFDNDGDQDIYVANDKDETFNNLYRNNGDGTFIEFSPDTNSNLHMGAMSTTIDDYDNDGWLDIYVTNLYPPFLDDAVQGNAFLQNEGGVFSNIAGDNGARFDSIGWGAVFLDADNDGDKDLYVSGSRIGSQGFLSAAFYQNDGNGDFTIPFGAGFETDFRRSYSNAIGDIQNDGLPDIIVLNIEDQPMFIWENTTTNENNWLKVKLEGTVSNRMGIGSKIKVITGDTVNYGYTLCGEGYIAQNSGSEFFGIGNATTIDAVEVHWLSGIVDRIENVDVNQTLTIIEGDNPLSVEDDVSSLDRIQIIPNPVKSSLHVEFPTSLLNGRLTIYDTTGRKLIEEPINSSLTNLSVAYLQSGLYIMNARNGDLSWSGRFVKE